MFNNNKLATVGIKNIGNTCYLSSILQCVAYSHSFLEFLTNHEFNEDLKLDSPYLELVKEFRFIILNLWSNNGIIIPSKFKALCEMGMIKSGWNGYQIGSHNDSHEYLEFLLQTLSEGLMYEPNININIKNSDNNLSETDKLALKAYTSWKTYFDKGYSNIIKLFFGQFISEIKKGDEITHTFEPFQVLSLEIPPKKGDVDITLTNCIEKFMESEQIDSNTQKRFYFWNTPQNLIISLKRFDNQGNKNDERIVYTDILDLSKFSKGYKREKVIYTLYGICCHNGTGQFGHYFSLCRKNGFPNWYKHDDENIRLIDSNGALPLTCSAYIFFYHQL